MKIVQISVPDKNMKTEKPNTKAEIVKSLPLKPEHCIRTNVFYYLSMGRTRVQQTLFGGSLFQLK